MMSVFSNVYNVWSSLENSYAGSGLTRTEYCKKLILWDSGETGYRSLTERIMRDSEDATEEQLSQLMEWISNLRDNLKRYETLGIPVTNLDDMKGSGEDTIASFNVLPKDVVVPMSEASKVGLIPVYCIINGNLERRMVDHVEIACANNSELLETISLMRSKNIDHPVLRGIAKYIKAGIIQTPLVIMQGPAAEELAKYVELTYLGYPETYGNVNFKLFKEEGHGVQVMSYQEVVSGI